MYCKSCSHSSQLLLAASYSPGQTHWAAPDGSLAIESRLSRSIQTTQRASKTVCLCSCNVEGHSLCQVCQDEMNLTFAKYVCLQNWRTTGVDALSINTYYRESTCLACCLVMMSLIIFYKGICKGLFAFKIIGLFGKPVKNFWSFSPLTY